MLIPSCGKLFLKNANVSASVHLLYLKTADRWYWNRRYSMNTTKNAVLPLVFFILFSMVVSGIPNRSSAADGDRLWDYGGVPIATPLNVQQHVCVTGDGDGGAILAWQDRRTGEDDIYAQRVDSQGNSLWTHDGVGICTAGGRQMSPRITGDGQGGVITAWWDLDDTDPSLPWRVFAQRLNGAGAPQWATNGVQVSTSAGITPTLTGANPISIISDMAGGAFIAFEAAPGPRVVHIDADGTLLGPGIDGIGLGGGVLTGGGPVITGDGSGGAIVVWAGNSENIVSQRMGADLSPLWGTDPVVISNDPRRESRPDITGSNTGGIIVSWVRQPELGDPPGTQVMVQKMDVSGNALWTPGGIVLVDSETVGGSDYAWKTFEVVPVTASDGLGGAIIAWNDWRNEPGTGGNDDVFAQRVNDQGTIQWAENGISLVQDPGGSQRRPQIAADQAGGAVVVFQDNGLGSWDIYGVGLNNLGITWRQYVYYGGSVPSEDNQRDPVIFFNGSGPSPTGAIIAWNDERNQNLDIYAQKVENSSHLLLPDLVVDSIVFTPAVPAQGQAFTAVITARNQGDAGTGGGFSIGLNGLQGGLFMDTCSCSAIEAGGTGGCSISYPDGKDEGSYPVTACVDCNPQIIYNNVIDESDEQNNSLEGTLVVTQVDQDPPTPDPMTWETPPRATGTSEVTMTATTATDASPPVEYYFSCLTGGCQSSDWQTDTTFTVTGLAANTFYGWRVMARDGSLYHNETAFSVAGYDYTDIETPSGVIFNLDDTGSTYLKVKVANTLSNLAEDQSGLIIYNTTANTDSGWKQDNEWWTSDNLTPNTPYQFQAKARNGYGRETPSTTLAMLFTDAALPGTAPFSNVTTSSITVNWTPNGNPGGCSTNYYCENTTTHANSGWTTELSWTDTGLDCSTVYSYRVKAQNAQGRETAWTDLGSQVTRDCSHPFPWCMFLPAIVGDGNR